MTSNNFIVLFFFAHGLFSGKLKATLLTWDKSLESYRFLHECIHTAHHAYYFQYILPQGPSYSTDTLVCCSQATCLSWHSFAYVIPSDPHTGLISSVHIKSHVHTGSPFSTIHIAPYKHIVLEQMSSMSWAVKIKNRTLLVGLPFHVSDLNFWCKLLIDEGWFYDGKMSTLT